MPVADNLALFGTAGCGCHQQVMSGTTVVGGGGNPDNGFGSEGFFLSGEEVQPTSFLSSGYNAANHTAEGMIGNPEGGFYAPQLSQAVRDLLSAPCTIVIDATFAAATRCYLLCDDGTNYFEIGIDNTMAVLDNTGAIGHTDLGFGGLVPAGRHKIAVTRTEGNIAASADGGAFHAVAGDSLAAFGTTVLGVGSDESIIHEFTILPAQDNADLPALSDLG